MMDYLDRSAAAMLALDRGALDRILAFVQSCTGTLWLCGNGGSASTAQHWACDLSKAAGRRVVALGSNPALLTAWANDKDYALALRQEFMALAQPGDALLCLSCSGVSANILDVLHGAGQRGMSRALLTGARGGYEAAADILVRVPSEDYGVIEDCHLAIGHWLTEKICASV